MTPAKRKAHINDLKQKLASAELLRSDHQQHANALEDYCKRLYREIRELDISKRVKT